MKWEADLSCDDFQELFYDNLSKTGSFKKAYLKSESLHEQLYNKRRYSSLDSFRVSLSKKKK